MNQNSKSIQIQRTESILKELIPEALSSLDDEHIRSLVVTEVDCKRGKYDADVYLDQSFIEDDEKPYIIKHLNKTKKYIQNYCLQAEGWFKCPTLHYKFDEQLEKQKKMDDLFAKIESELSKNDK